MEKLNSKKLLSGEFSDHKFLVGVLLISGWLFILYEYAVRISQSVIIHPLMSTFNIDLVGIGVLSSAYYIPYIIMQIPAGIIMDRFGLIKSFSVAILIVACGSYLFSISHTVDMAVLGRVLMGIGSSFAWVGIVNLGYIMFNEKYHATVIGISMVLCMLGAIIGQEPWLYLTTYLGSWQLPYKFAASFGVILAIIVFVSRLRFPNINKITYTTDIITIIKSMKYFVTSRVFWVLAIYTTVISLPQNAFTALWAIEFFKQSYGFNANFSATITSCVWIGGALGAPLIGLLSSSVNNQKRLLMIFNIITLLITIVLIFVKIHSILFMTILLFMMGFVTNASVIAYAIAAKIGGNEKISATVVSSINMLNMGGASLVQIFMGYILSMKHIKPSGLSNFEYALAIMPITLIISWVLIYFIELNANYSSTKEDAKNAN